MIRKIRQRWTIAGIPMYDDFWVPVPWWLRIKRFFHDGRDEHQVWRDLEESWKADEYERGGK